MAFLCQLSKTAACSSTTLLLAVETSLLSPLIKSVLTAREPAALKHRGRVAVMHRIEQRMRFLGVRF